MSKSYAIICSEGLSAFDQSIMRMLNDFAEAKVNPRAAVIVALTDTDEVATFYHEATMQDMMLAKGFIDLDIQSDNFLGNLPHFVDVAHSEGLMIDVDGEDEDYPDEEE